MEFSLRQRRQRGLWHNLSLKNVAKVLLTILLLVVVVHLVSTMWYIAGEGALFSSIISPSNAAITATTATSSSLSFPGERHETQSSFTIVVLAMNRFASLERLLKSLDASDYGKDRVDLVVRFDRPKDASTAWFQEVDKIRTWTAGWRPGNSSVTVANEQMGLRKAWLEAWKPDATSDRAIIFEDDIEVSPVWYRWLQGAHNAYDGRPDMAGISLQRQTLIPLIAAKNTKIPDNGGQPFLYRLVGSIGYSPTASVWRDFLDFAECALASDMDVSVPGFITSKWYNSLDKRSMWTQLFIYFCYHRELSTLYMFPPRKRALAAHWREKGEHHGATQGRDFDLVESSTQTAPFEYPVDLTSLGWDAKPLQSKTVVRSLVMSVAMGYGKTEFDRFVLGLRKHYSGGIALLISSSALPEIKQMLVENDVIVVETNERGGPRASAAWYRIIKSRYSFYKESCRQDQYDLCMMVDFRDVLFQADPFAQMSVPLRPTLHVYLHNILVNKWTIGEVSKCSGGDPSWIQGEWLINAGGIIASPSIISRLSGINDAFGVDCDDQVALNLAVYGKKIPDAEVVLHKQGTGSINNAAWGGEFRTDSRKRILNHDCFPAPVVHQFDVIESTRARAQQG